MVKIDLIFDTSQIIYELQTWLAQTCPAFYLLKLFISKHGVS